MIQNNYAGALQKPIGSGFNATSTTSDVMKGIDLKGKIAIIAGGVYPEDVDIAELVVDPSIPNGVKPYSLDETSAKQLWNLTEEMTGVIFNAD